MIKNLKISIGVDHRGFELKKYLTSLKNINNFQISWLDVGTNNNQRTDYPIYAQKAISALIDKKVDLAILSCGSGIGMSIAANRYKNIYAGLVWSCEIAKLAKEDDNINVLVLPADFISNEQAYEIIHTWLNSKFKSEQYLNRLNMLNNI